ncbi:hypothetical protein [uncultured Dubosiella sp.]|uniref:hypothetical protein n=1 Tax=uncultured Dubosiella sp. TaxID=1937011 RepID=UPI0025B28FF4|nr:hypothetical protein [uncultured Dubosiella sp.]
MKIRATKPTISRLERELDAFLFDRAKGSKVAQTIQKGYVFCEPNDLEEVKKLIPNIQKIGAGAGYVFDQDQAIGGLGILNMFSPKEIENDPNLLRYCLRQFPRVRRVEAKTFENDPFVQRFLAFEQSERFQSAPQTIEPYTLFLYDNLDFDENGYLSIPAGYADTTFRLPGFEVKGSDQTLIAFPDLIEKDRQLARGRKGNILVAGDVRPYLLFTLLQNPEVETVTFYTEDTNGLAFMEEVLVPGLSSNHASYRGEAKKLDGRDIQDGQYDTVLIVDNENEEKIQRYFDWKKKQKELKKTELVIGDETTMLMTLRVELATWLYREITNRPPLEGPAFLWLQAMYADTTIKRPAQLSELLALENIQQKIERTIEAAR